MFQSTSDKVALATAGVLASTPFWNDHLQNANDVAVLLGPTLSGLPRRQDRPRRNPDLQGMERDLEVVAPAGRSDGFAAPKRSNDA
jgi:hypothetical protein